MRTFHRGIFLNISQTLSILMRQLNVPIEQIQSVGQTLVVEFVDQFEDLKGAIDSRLFGQTSNENRQGTFAQRIDHRLSIGQIIIEERQTTFQIVTLP